MFDPVDPSTPASGKGRIWETQLAADTYLPSEGA